MHLTSLGNLAMNPHPTTAATRVFRFNGSIALLVAVLWIHLTPARAAVIYSGFQNLEIPTTFDGIYLDIDTGITGTSEAAGWDINPFFGGSGVANSPAFQPDRTGTGNSDPIFRITVGATVNDARLFSTNYGGSQTHLGPQFTDGMEGYLGFRFETNANAGPYYGWMRVTFTGNTAGAVIKDWAYEDSGGAIVTGRVQQSAASAGKQTVGLSPGSGEAFTLGKALADTGGNVNSVVKTGLGTTILAVANTYTGGTTISGGVLGVGNRNALGTTGTISFSGGTLQFSAANTTDYSARFSTASSQSYSLDTNGQAVTLATALTSAGGALNKSGAGTLTLSGLNTYSGTTTVSAGTLVLDKSGTGALASTSAIALGGGTFSVLGKTGANVTAQTMASLAVNGPTCGLVIKPNEGTSTTLTITSNTVTRSAGGAVSFDTSAGTPATAMIAWNPALSGGIIGGGFTIKDNANTGFATVTAGKVTRFTGGTVLTASNPNNVNTDFRATTAGTITNTVTGAALNSLTIDTAAGAAIWDLGNKVASITTGGLLMTGAANYTIQNGSLQSASANHDLVLNQYAVGALTISAAIGGTTTSLTKTGSGKLILNGAQTYGTLTVSGGITAINGLVGTGTTSVTVIGAGTALKFGSVSQNLASLTIGAGATLTFSSGVGSFSGGDDGGKTLSLDGDPPASGVVPEPGTLGLLLAGALAALHRRQRQTANNL